MSQRHAEIRRPCDRIRAEFSLMPWIGLAAFGQRDRRYLHWVALIGLSLPTIRLTLRAHFRLLLSQHSSSPIRLDGIAAVSLTIQLSDNDMCVSWNIEVDWRLAAPKLVPPAQVHVTSEEYRLQ